MNHLIVVTGEKKTKQNYGVCALIWRVFLSMNMPMWNVSSLLDKPFNAKVAYDMYFANLLFLYLLFCEIIHLIVLLFLFWIWKPNIVYHQALSWGWVHQVSWCLVYWGKSKLCWQYGYREVCISCNGFHHESVKIWCFTTIYCISLNTKNAFKSVPQQLCKISTISLGNSASMTKKHTNSWRKYTYNTG